MAMALATLSTIFGWIYFGFWALAFYGQLYTNWRLKSVVGYSLNFQLLSMTAFTFYSYVNIMGYFFQDTNPYNDYGLGAVSIQDLYFSLHSLLLTCLIGIQCLVYPVNFFIFPLLMIQREPNRLSNATFGITVIAWVIAIIFLIIYEATSWIPTDQDSNLYTVLGGLTLILTAFKYVPAAHWNFQRKSTVGWSSIYIVCEFLGAFFSLIQSVIDVSYGVSQFINPFKFSLGNIAIIFDVLFMIQRFLLFKDAHKKNIIIYESGDQYKRLQEKSRNHDLCGSRISVM